MELITGSGGGAGAGGFRELANLQVLPTVHTASPLWLSNTYRHCRVSVLH